MKRLISTLAISASIAMAAPAFAGSSQKFDSSLSTAITAPVAVEVVIGEDLAYRADHVSPNLRDRRSRKLNAGFSNKGMYGERDLERLAERLERKVADRFEKYGVMVDPNSATKVTLVISDAEPNRPTFNQLGSEPGLSYQSVALGGASFEGIITSNDNVLGEMNYAWYETNIRDASYGGTWSDANRAIDRFAKKTAKALAHAQTGAGS